MKSNVMTLLDKYCLIYYDPKLKKHTMDMFDTMEELNQFRKELKKENEYEQIRMPYID